MTNANTSRMYPQIVKGFATAAVDDAMRVNRRKLDCCLQHFFRGPLTTKEGKPLELLQCMVCEGYLPLEIGTEYACDFAARYPCSVTYRGTNWRRVGRRRQGSATDFDA
jgi:hypothetical protein